MAQQKKGGRRTGRRRAFEVLYGLSFGTWPQSIQELDHAYTNAPDSRSDSPAEDAAPRDDFAWGLTAGVWKLQDEIDGTINTFSQHWKLSRIARIELTILRLALYEMLHADDVPLKVAINEAVELAKRYGDDNSKNFVNGILDAVARAVEHGELRVR